MEYFLFLGFILSIGSGVGIISSTPLGPINLLVAENYLSEKKVKIVPFLIGVILVDSIFGYLTFWGFEKFLSDYQIIGAGIGIIGGLAIIAIGAIGVYQQFKGKNNKKKIEIKKNIFLSSSTASLSKGFVLCGSNPGFIAFWGWVAYNAKNWTTDSFPQFDLNIYNLILFPIGIIIGDFIWFGLFTFLLKRGARRYSGSLIDKIRIFISWGLIALGVFTLYASLGLKDKVLIKITSDHSTLATGYINLDGDTIIPLGKYKHCYTDTISDFAIVMTKENKLIGIDLKERELFEVVSLNNTPDLPSEGLFRIKRKGKVGFANDEGVIVINPKFKYAEPFKDGKAKVCNNCSIKNNEEYNGLKMQNAFYINKKGDRIKD